MRACCTSGCSLTGIKSFSDKLTIGPIGSGSVTGSLLMICCCKMLSRTRVISAHQAQIELTARHNTRVKTRGYVIMARNEQSCVSPTHGVRVDPVRPGLYNTQH